MTWLALLLHVGLMAAASLLLLGVAARVTTAAGGEMAPPLLQPWRDLVRLGRKTAPLPPGASFLFSAAPVMAVAACTVAAVLTPSFILGMPVAGGADLVVVAGLLAVSHLALALALHDTGWAVLAHAGAAASMARVGIAPLVLLVAMAVLLVSGGTNIDAAVAAVRDGGMVAHVAGLLAGLALLAALAAEPGLPTDAFPGRLGALVLAAAGLRFAVGVALAGAIAVPFGVAAPGGGAVAWGVGILCWVVKITVLGVLVQSVRGWRFLLPAAALLALIAVALASVQGRA